MTFNNDGTATNGARLVLHIVHCGLKESRAYFQQRRQFNGARLVPYHRRHIMAEHDTNNIQAMLKFCPYFDGKDKAHFLDYKDKLRVTSSTIGGGGECNIFVPVLSENGTKIAPTGDRFDQPPGQMR